jgi:predicted  nucleic acid-binding Zn-ribbon protein
MTMVDEPENLTLRMFRHLDAKLDRIHDLTARMSSVEDQLVALRTEIVGLRTDVVRLEHRMDRFDDQLVRIKRRLDLTEA